MSLLFNSSYRKQWIDSELSRIQAAGADGINFDIEGAEAVPANTAAGLVNLFREMRLASVQRGWEHFQISLDNPIYAGQPQLAIACKSANNDSFSSCF